MFCVWLLVCGLNSVACLLPCVHDSFVFLFLACLGVGLFVCLFGLATFWAFACLRACVRVWLRVYLLLFLIMCAWLSALCMCVFVWFVVCLCVCVRVLFVNSHFWFLLG